MAQPTFFKNLDQVRNNLFCGQIPTGCIPEKDNCDGIIISETNPRGRGGKSITYAKASQGNIVMDQIPGDSLDPFFIMARAEDSSEGLEDGVRPTLSRNDRMWLAQNGVPF